MNAPTQKKSANIIPSHLPPQMFLPEEKISLHATTKDDSFSFITVSWTSGLCYAAGNLYRHYSLPSIAARGVHPILMPKVSCFLPVNLIPVSVLPTPLFSFGLRFDIGKSNSKGLCSTEFYAVIIDFSLRAKTRYHATTNQRRCGNSFIATHHHRSFCVESRTFPTVELSELKRCLFWLVRWVWCTDQERYAVNSFILVARCFVFTENWRVTL